MSSWNLTKDGDVNFYEFLFKDHYSAGKNRKRKQKQFVGPGENIVLISDKLTPLLMSLGLVKGITPTSMRRKLDPQIRAFVLSRRGGGGVESQKRV